jgi:hypothetical protein
MIRQIIKPSKRTITVEIPESFIGKKIELLAFEVDEKQEERDISEIKRSSSIEELFEKFDGLTFDSKGTYFFDRDEAND